MTSEPGEVVDLTLGVPGDAEPLPENDADNAFPTEVNDDDDDDDEAEEA